MTMSRPQPANRPKEVDYSFWLWISWFVLGVLGFLLSYQQIRETTTRQMRASDPTIDPATLENVTTAGFTVGLVFALLIIAVEVVFVFLMRGGRNWARIVMVVLGGIALLFGLIGLLIGLTSASGLMSVVGLLQVLLLAGAIVMMFRPAANAWFRSPSPQL